MTKADRQMLEERTYKAGGGVWFRKDTFERVWVEVDFYPKLVLKISDSAGKRKISRGELEAGYSRLRL